MAQRALNKVQLIGNLTRDPELRYTPQGTAVCTIGLATNRSWVTETGEKKEDVEFHRLVAWNKLAEICSQLLFKGRRIYVEGRLQTRQWTGKDGVERQTTEVVINDMIILDSKRSPDEKEEPETSKRRPEKTAEESSSGKKGAVQEEEDKNQSNDQPESSSAKKTASESASAADDQGKKKAGSKADEEKEKEIQSDDIPF